MDTVMTKPLTPYTDTAIDMFVVRYLGKRPTICDSCGKGIPRDDVYRVEPYPDGELVICSECIERVNDEVTERRAAEGWR